MFVENTLKVQQKISELNKEHYTMVPGSTLGTLGHFTSQWIAVPGYFAVTGFSNTDGKPVFNPSFGVTVKVFSNIVTGEIKMFSSKLFE